MGSMQHFATVICTQFKLTVHEDFQDRRAQKSAQRGPILLVMPAYSEAVTMNLKEAVYLHREARVTVDTRTHH